MNARGWARHLLRDAPDRSSTPSSTTGMRHFPSLLLIGLGACAATTSLAPEAELAGPATTGGYALAAALTLPDAEPEHVTGLHNLFRLSENIYSGAEPENEAALRQLAAMGIRTIMSVDGAPPNHAVANQLGMRYVHVPICYDGISDTEALAIAKSFRELDGPFYVHCFHGRHRGPAAAALGRLVLDGVSRQRALAEMRQWCGTASKYDGLYADIAFDEIPTAAATESFAFDFPQVCSIDDYRLAMTEMARGFDAIKALSKADWSSESAADVSAVAAQFAGVVARTEGMEAIEFEDQQYLGWLRETEGAARRVAALLREHQAGDTAAGREATRLVASIKGTCNTCHSSYRN